MKAYTLKLVALSLALASTSALAQQRLIVSYPKPEINAMSALTANTPLPQQHCFMLAEQQSWCVPKPAAAGKMFSQHHRIKETRCFSAKGAAHFFGGEGIGANALHHRR